MGPTVGVGGGGGGGGGGQQASSLISSKQAMEFPPVLASIIIKHSI